MNFCYIRFSTSSQDEQQQVQAIKDWTEPRGITIDVIEKDEGVSGGVSYRDRKLSGLVRKMKAGDTLIVSEISRLGRSMGDLNLLINEELKPRKVRLIVTKMNLDLDCANLKAIDEMIFFAFSFSAQIEKELIQSRTQSALDARKEAIIRDGGFIAKSGRFCTRLGQKKGFKNPNACEAMAARRTELSQGWKENSWLYTWVTIQLLKGRPRKDIVEEAQKCYEENPEKYGTRQGRPLSPGVLSKWASEILKRA